MLIILLCCVLCDKNELTQSMSQEAVNDNAITNKGVINSIKNYVKNLAENVQVPIAKANTKTQSKPYSSSFESTTNDINERTDSEKMAYGSCGKNVYFTLYSDGKLVISGSGNMENGVSWNSINDYVKSVVIENSVTSIGTHAFYRCYNMTSVNISDDVKSIGKKAFYDCSSLISINLPNGITSINEQTMVINKVHKFIS